MDGEYWNPRTETWDAESKRRWQLHKLRELVGWAKQTPWWRRRLASVEVESLRSLDDLRRLPFLTREEIRQDQEESPPFGAGLTVDPSWAMTRHETSGTSGRRPLAFLQTRRDWYWGAYAWAQALWGFGIRPQDVVYLAFGYGPFIGFWGAHYALQLIGCTTVAGGAQPSEARVRQILATGATALVATPSYLFRLAEVAQDLGVDWRTSKLRYLLVAGEPGGNIPSTRDQLEERFLARVGDFIGMTETAGIAAFTCQRARGYVHIAENYFLEEVIDPKSGEPVPVGELGERVTTAFGLGSYPIIRYRTGDLVRRLPHNGCDCGRTFDLYHGGILGRVDNLLVIRGVNVHPSGVEAVVRANPAVREFRVVAETVQGRDEIRVEWEPYHSLPEGQLANVSRELAAQLAERHEGLRFAVEAVSPGTLPVWELKARRVVDRRPPAVSAMGKEEGRVP